MTIYTYVLRYPEGDEREIEHQLNFNQLVDINGNPVHLPLPTPKTIIYRVFKVSTNDNRYETTRYYYLELITGRELQELASPTWTPRR